VTLSDVTGPNSWGGNVAVSDVTGPNSWGRNVTVSDVTGPQQLAVVVIYKPAVTASAKRVGDSIIG